MKLTQKEQEALKNVIELCIDQYETSGGDIDYTGLGEEALPTLEKIKEKLTEEY